MSHNLYLLRNVLTAKVLVSPSIKLDSKILAQIGEQRPQNKIRPDHWVPFLVVTGFKDARTVEGLQNAIAPPLAYYGPKERLPLSIKGSPFPGWSIPEKVTERTLSLCSELCRDRRVHNEVYGTGAVNRTLAKRVDSTLTSKSLDISEMGDLEPILSYTMWWERDEFRCIADTTNNGWPSFVEHKKLKLQRGRFPIWPKGSNVVDSVW
ncbi:hypothetical protein BSLG_010105 [Batrachochytrium salamandrivorans]|nr:hypothetical protein BSLG_010105 [Batrachochytrium salamandrivorans]